MGGSKSKLLQDNCEKCLTHVDEIDRAMVGFLKSLDSMTATLRIISVYHSAPNEQQTVLENGQEIFSEKKLTKDVLSCIEESISFNKNETLMKLRKLFRFIIDSVEKNTSLKPKGLQLDNYNDCPSRETFFIDGVKNNYACKIKQLEEQLDIVQRREQSLQKEKKEIFSERTALHELNDRLEKDNEKLTNELEEMKNELKQSKDEITKLREDFQQECNTEKENFEKTISSMNEKKESLENEVESLRNDLKAERNETNELRAENRRLQDELKNCKTKRILPVQLFYQRRGGLITEVEDGLKGVLKSRLEDDGKTELKFITCNNSFDINPDMPTLLIAISASRIGTDAANAIHGLDTYLSKKILLLIFHHKDIHALPSQASERVLTGPEFKCLGGIHDMAFLTQKGIYDCELNENSVATVTSFINNS